MVPLKASGVTVSVALCSHNGAEFIEEQLLSILNQSHPPDEIVISDDASTDDTVGRALAILNTQNLGGGGPAVDFTIVRNSEALGVSANFQQAVSACKGDLVVLCDQDDRWARNRVALGVGMFASRPDLLLLHSDARLVDERGDELPVTLFEALEISPATISEIHDGRAFDVLMRRNVVTGATTMFRRRLVDSSLPFAAGWVHDEWLAIMASIFGEVDVSADKPIDYRQHGANQIGVSKLNLAGKFRRLMEPGAARNRRLLERAHALVDRLEALPDNAVDQSYRESARQKLEHEIRRSRLPRCRFFRPIPVFKELATGRYTRFGHGLADAVRDLIQPL